MPLPQLIFREISNIATLAAKLDQFVLNSRNTNDESYGPEDNINAKITLSLAALQCHVKKGLPFNSPRLSGVYNWLKLTAIDSPDILTAPLRLAAAAIVKVNPDLVKSEIINTISLLNQCSEKATINKPILFMLSIEALSLFGVNSSNNDIVDKAFLKLSEILHSTTENLSISSYAAMLLLLYGNENQKKEAINKWKEIVKLFNNDEQAWHKCIVETSYITLNALQCIKQLPELSDTINEAIEFLWTNCPNGIPKDNLIKYTPKELGDNIQTKKIYAASVITQAIVESLGANERGCLEFAHASWKLEVINNEEKINNLISSNAKILNEKEEIGKSLIKRIQQYQIYLILPKRPS